MGQSVSVYKYHIKLRQCVYTWLLKVYFQCESAYFQKKNFWIFILNYNFEINFQCERGISLSK